MSSLIWQIELVRPGRCTGDQLAATQAAYIKSKRKWVIELEMSCNSKIFRLNNWLLFIIVVLIITIEVRFCFVILSGSFSTAPDHPDLPPAHCKYWPEGNGTRGNLGLVTAGSGVLPVRSSTSQHGEGWKHPPFALTLAQQRGKKICATGRGDKHCGKAYL